MRRGTSGHRVLSALSAVEPRGQLPTTAEYAHALRTIPEHEWQTNGAKKAVAIFQMAAQRVPAYKDFLKKHRIRPGSVRTVEDFVQVVPTTKENYIRQYPLAERSWDGKLYGQSILAISSGTTGAPTLWPRGEVQEQEAVLVHSLLFEELFSVHTHRTLVVVNFPMGVYVSGVATAVPLIRAAGAFPLLSIAPIGNTVDATLSFLTSFAMSYEQIVLVGHPFFLKTIIEAAHDSRAKWLARKIGLLCCSEGFSESWREYVSDLAGMRSKTRIFSTYGSSEFLLVGYENPHTVAIRRLCTQKPMLSESLFGSPVVPSLFQYNPLLRYIETLSDELLITSASGIPLVRFNQHDGGKVVSSNALYANLPQRTKLPRVEWQLPLVALFGRTDRTLVYYAVNIYPEHVQAALGSQVYVPLLTGKFVMEKRHTDRMDQEFVIHIEMRKGIAGHKDLAERIAHDIEQTLTLMNAEYADARAHMHRDMKPHVHLCGFEDQTYFPAGVKPRFLMQTHV